MCRYICILPTAKTLGDCTVRLVGRCSMVIYVLLVCSMYMAVRARLSHAWLLGRARVSPSKLRRLAYWAEKKRALGPGEGL
jgi:hypothetical protein